MLNLVVLLTSAMPEVVLSSETQLILTVADLWQKDTLAMPVPGDSICHIILAEYKERKGYKII